MIAALILAAGVSSRMKRTKQLLPVGNRTMLEAVLEAAAGSRADKTLVVLGHDSERIIDEIDLRGAEVVMCDDYERGMSASLSTGLRALGESFSAVVVLLGDQPRVTSTLIDELIEQYVRTGRLIVAPMSGGERRNPVLLSLTLRDEMLETEGDIGAKQVIDGHTDETAYLVVPDKTLFVDVDTPKDYAGVLEESEQAD